ncbi:hypothetical protein Cantr_04347 [Candida viswanathii]|uniref:Uncharacterized protein n=1 Tax=Candida viswanathii TaxID=5486 RepID=A0A367XNM4_9ASCO|nr:hypothetical protein Cantr_04347 [Candida viswanathii]
MYLYQHALEKSQYVHLVKRRRSTISRGVMLGIIIGAATFIFATIWVMLKWSGIRRYFSTKTPRLSREELQMQEQETPRRRQERFQNLQRRVDEQLRIPDERERQWRERRSQRQLQREQQRQREERLAQREYAERQRNFQNRLGRLHGTGNSPQAPSPARPLENSVANHNVIAQPPADQSEYTNDHVPPYSVEATENDLGYYDAEGIFHEADPSKRLTPPPSSKSSSKTQTPTNVQATSRPATAQAQPPTQPSANLPTQVRDANADTPVSLDPGEETPAAPTNQSEYPDDLVPPYSAKTNENDMGYFDADGVFHANESMESPPPPAHVRHSERSSVGTASPPALLRNDTRRVTPLMMRTLRY